MSIHLTTNQDLAQISFKDYAIFYNNLASAQQTILEIFDEQPYRFHCEKASPLIIDAGSNIGIATLFFSELYPNANILCFEPDPNAFDKLQLNTSNNKVANVHLINAALARQSGESDFFGQIFVDSPDARGNSIIGDWGLQRKVSDSTKVQSVTLSSYIDSEVDFLKLDIEGAEQQVLEDLEAENKLPWIREIAIEVHQADLMKEQNDVDSILKLLKRNGFRTDTAKRDLSGLLPDEIKNWVEKVKPELFVLKAIRDNT